jgi:hypothetical protein
MDLKEICDVMDWIILVKGRVPWVALLNMVINLLIPQKASSILAINSFLKKNSVPRSYYYFVI